MALDVWLVELAAEAGTVAGVSLMRKTGSGNTADVVSIQGAAAREYYEIREVVDGLAARLTAGTALQPC